MKKYFFVFFLLVISAFGFFVFEKIKFDDGKLHIVFCNVGQGDGIFIRSPKGADILVDSGPDDSILSCLSSHMPFWDRTIELAMLTHPHEDHMKGYEYVLKRYKILNFSTEAVANNTSTYKKVQSDVSQDKIKERDLLAGDNFKLSNGLEVKILGPSKEFLSKTSPKGVITESEGFGNIISEISYKGFNLLLTGDSQITGLEDAIRQIQGINVLQIPHHGSKYGTNEEILKMLRPQLAIISVGKNKYGHPSPIVLKDLHDLAIKYLRTDQKGDVEIVVNKNGSFKVL